MLARALRRLPPPPSEKVKQSSVRPILLIPERVVPAFGAHDLVWREGWVVELVDIPWRHRRVRVALIDLSVERPSALAIRTIHSL